MANYFRNENFKNSKAQKKCTNYKKKFFEYININHKIKKHISVPDVNK